MRIKQATGLCQRIRAAPSGRKRPPGSLKRCQRYFNTRQVAGVAACNRARIAASPAAASLHRNTNPARPLHRGCSNRAQKSVSGVSRTSSSTIKVKSASKKPLQNIRISRADPIAKQKENHTSVGKPGRLVHRTASIPQILVLMRPHLSDDPERQLCLSGDGRCFRLSKDATKLRAFQEPVHTVLIVGNLSLTGLGPQDGRTLSYLYRQVGQRDDNHEHADDFGKICSVLKPRLFSCRNRGIARER